MSGRFPTRRAGIFAAVTAALSLSFTALAPASAAEPKKRLVVGVYLPGTIADGAGRFAFAEAFADVLGDATGREGVARNFARYEDFSRAAASGLLEVIVADGWALAQSGLKHTPVASAVRANDGGGRWAIISRSRSSMKGLQGKRLAVLKAAKGSEARYVTNAIFMGELNAQKSLRIVPVPDVESALKALEARSVEAALVPLAAVPAGVNVLYRTSKIPGAIVGVLRGNADEVGDAVTALERVAPFEKFVRLSYDEVQSFGRLVARGPPRRQCVMAESPLVRVEPKALIRFSEVGKVMPAFTDFIAAPNEQPDD